MATRLSMVAFSKVSPATAPACLKGHRTAPAVVSPLGDRVCAAPVHAVKLKQSKRSKRLPPSRELTANKELSTKPLGHQTRSNLGYPVSWLDQYPFALHELTCLTPSGAAVKQVYTYSSP